MPGAPQVVAVVTAGRSPHEKDPLVMYTQGTSKALVPIAGKPMIEYVVEAIARSSYVKHIIIVALHPPDAVHFSIPVAHVPDTGDMLTNIEHGIRYAEVQYPNLDAVLLSSSDVPMITPTIVDTFIETCWQTDHELYYSIVERSIMENRFPGSRRSYVHLRDGDFAGGDLVLIRAGTALQNRSLWQRLAAARKNPLRQARLFGWWPLIRLLMKRMSLHEAELRASRALGVRGRAIPFPYAEIGMDVDKPFQLEIVRRELERRTLDRYLQGSDPIHPQTEAP